MAEFKQQRKHLFVDPKVQGALIIRVMLYWVVCLIGLTLLLLCWQILTSPPRPFYVHFHSLWSQYGPALIATCMLLPLALIDVIRFSNRFVGPLLRLRRSMRELARGAHVAPIEFRTGDFWLEFADEFNAVRTRFEALAAASPCDREEDPEPLAVN